MFVRVEIIEKDAHLTSLARQIKSKRKTHENRNKISFKIYTWFVRHEMTMMARYCADDDSNGSDD